MSVNFSRLLPPSGRPAVMGILNLTPDSFSDGGRLLVGGRPDLHLVADQAQEMVAGGVDIFDVGGESTRPGAQLVSPEEELARVLPVVSLLKSRFAIPVSVDTSCPRVIAATAAEGADMINDVRALTRPGALEAAVRSELPVCLMHMRGEPGEMQQLADYVDVVAEVKTFLRERVAACEQAGISRNRIAIDPGFGFAKNLEHNLALFRALGEFAGQDLPLLVGVSRKRMVGDLLGRAVGERLHGSLALALLAAQQGARIIRVHDVAATVDVLKTLMAIEGA
ncbi:MAG: dihydropteroate synthase [Gammaproteobacteria bacterium BRH_c0]|nr:MAG: dihydropteroate synthase [Gammaproteobacteria bacterium BRH_c0]